MGKRFQMNVTSGKTYRLRLVNAVVESMFKFMIESHNLTIIATDLVPIHPIPNKRSVSITMDPGCASVCLLGESSPDDIYGFLNYVDKSNDRLLGPISPSGYDQPPMPTSTFVYKKEWNNTCYDEPMDALRPFVAKECGRNAHLLRLDGFINGP
ncbi:Cupredoxin [Penicillium capsulatum]|uniref:Cupredoxin n=1 Tax=Penicillium capsulatum TaxID=69766 RepID=A0A9W9IMN8_9EURO|nr:Cupredoxin [Penicillium capsulatum]